MVIGLKLFLVCLIYKEEKEKKYACRQINMFIRVQRMVTSALLIACSNILVVANAECLTMHYGWNGKGDLDVESRIKADLL